MVDLAELANRIKQRAHDMGFDLCGIAPAEPSAFKPQYLAWLAKGFHGEMGYLARDPDRRTDPSLVLPDAKSIVSVAINYYTGEDGGEDDPERAVFARYARGDDYHDVMTPRLRELLAWIKEVCPEVPSSEVRVPGSEEVELLGQGRGGWLADLGSKLEWQSGGVAELTTDDGRRTTDETSNADPYGMTAKAAVATEGRVYVDTGPILEREVAQRAGLGWFGKNTMLINTRRGSYFLLGEILLNLPLPPDAPAIGGCGTCTKCIDACPTGAIVRPFELDATRCISYLTIEQKGPIPSEFAEKMGNRVFGCDICQECCPFNARRAAPTSEPAFQPREVTSHSKMADLLQMSEEKFRETFAKSPVRRAKWRGLMRNVAAALSSSDNAPAEVALNTALDHPEPMVRQ